MKFHIACTWNVGNSLRDGDISLRMSTYTSTQMSIRRSRLPHRSCLPHRGGGRVRTLSESWSDEQRVRARTPLCGGYLEFDVEHSSGCIVRGYCTARGGQ